MGWLSETLGDEGKLISCRQVRDVLSAMDDKGRSDALWLLGHIVSKDGQWQAFVKPFIEQAWPRQVKFRTESASRGFAHLVEQSGDRSEEHTSELQSLMRTSYAVFCLKKKKSKQNQY